jgi:hypothetical protein
MHRFRLASAIVGAPIFVSLAGVATTFAQPIPISGELQANTYTTGSQSGPTVVAHPDGGAFVVWTGANDQDGDRNGVFGRRLSAAGAFVGDEFQVNTETYLSQSRADAAADSSGNFVVVWESDLQDGNNRAVVGQRFDASGSPAGTEFIVNTETLGNQFNAHVGRADDGSFVVVFVDSNDLDGDSRGIFARMYDAGGAPTGTQFQVNTYTTSSQDYPDASMAPDGSFVVVWTTGSGAVQDGDGQGIVGRRFDAAGDPSGGEFIVNSYTTGNQLNASVVSAPDGGFVAVWEASGGQDGDSIGVFARAFGPSGNALGEDFQVNAYTTGLRFGGRAAPQPGGGFAFVWTSRNQDGDSNGVFSRTYSAAGVASAEVQVNETTADSQSTGVLANTDSFVAAWGSTAQEGDSRGIFARRFDVAMGTTTTTLPGPGSCGDRNGDGITATDALFVLQSAVGLQTCELCICDVAGGGSITATDALIALQIAVGSMVPLMCPPC